MNRLLYIINAHLRSYIEALICFLLTASTREVILGTENGQLHEIAVDEKDKREKYIKFLFELSEYPEAFEGLQVSCFPKLQLL